MEENSYWIDIFVFSLSKEARASSLRPTQIGTHQWQRLYGLSLIPLVDQSVSWCIGKIFATMYMSKMHNCEDALKSMTFSIQHHFTIIDCVIEFSVLQLTIQSNLIHSNLIALGFIHEIGRIMCSKACIQILARLSHHF